MKLSCQTHFSSRLAEFEVTRSTYKQVLVRRNRSIVHLVLQLGYQLNHTRLKLKAIKIQVCESGLRLGLRVTVRVSWVVVVPLIAKLIQSHSVTLKSINHWSVSDSLICDWLTWEWGSLTDRRVTVSVRLRVRGKNQTTKLPWLISEWATQWREWHWLESDWWP